MDIKQLMFEFVIDCKFGGFDFLIVEGCVGVFWVVVLIVVEICDQLLCFGYECVFVCWFGMDLIEVCSEVECVVCGGGVLQQFWWEELCVDFVIGVVFVVLVMLVSLFCSFDVVVECDVLMGVLQYGYQVDQVFLNCVLVLLFCILGLDVVCEVVVVVLDCIRVGWVMDVVNSVCEFYCFFGGELLMMLFFVCDEECVVVIVIDFVCCFILCQFEYEKQEFFGVVQCVFVDFDGGWVL